MKTQTYRTGKRRAPTDFSVMNCGSICILNAHTPRAREWAAAHLPSDRQTWGVSGTVVEPRYLGPILDGIRDDGLTCD